MGKKAAELTQNQVAVRWAVRVFIIGTLVLFLVLVLLERSAKANSEASAAAWVDKHGELISGGDCKVEDLEDVMSGNPSVHRGELDDMKDPRDATSVLVYEWQGAFNTYAVYVAVIDFEILDTDNYIVENIEGPKKL